MKYSLILLILIPFLSGCGTVQLDSIKAIEAACPDLRVYPPVLQKKVACELVKNAPKIPATIKFLKDYQDNRDQDRICRGLPVPAKPKNASINCK